MVREARIIAEYIVNTDEEEKRLKSSGVNYEEYFNDKVVKFIANPVVEHIVRCKDCKYWKVNSMKYGLDCHTDPNGFCAWGERKTNERAGIHMR